MAAETKNEARLRRCKRVRKAIARRTRARLVTFRSSRHIYAQITTPSGDRVLAAAGSVEATVRGEKINKCDIARKVGALIGERALAADIELVAFDRSGYKYHGRVAALAEGARAAGLKF